MSTEFYWIAVAFVTVISAARITRLAVYDRFPPVRAIRDVYKVYTEDSDWSLLAMCGFCASFWVTGLIVVWADLSGVFDGKPLADWMTPVWWLVNGTFAASYLAATYIANDGDTSAEDEPDETEDTA